jgi:hypothetical protein
MLKQVLLNLKDGVSLNLKINIRGSLLKGDLSIDTTINSPEFLTDNMLKVQMVQPKLTGAKSRIDQKGCFYRLPQGIFPILSDFKFTARCQCTGCKHHSWSGERDYGDHSEPVVCSTLPCQLKIINLR